MLKNTPHDLVGFKVFRRSQNSKQEGSAKNLLVDDMPGRPAVDKRMIRVKNAARLPLGVWAAFVHSHALFTSIILTIIVVNALILGIQTKMSREGNTHWYDAFEMIDMISLLVFILEIILKWMDNFHTFWHDGWNIFDFIVTILSAVPNIITFTTGRPSSEGGIENQFRVFRTLRLLKMVAKVRNLRVIIKTIFDAFKSMAWILLLLVMFAYIFAIFAINLFGAYTDSTDPTLLYQEKFKDLPQAFITLFQLLTLDQWYFIEKDIHRVVPAWTTILFFLVWYVGILDAEFSPCLYIVLYGCCCIRCGFEGCMCGGLDLASR